MLKLASPVHDLGKIVAPGAILNIPRKLTPEAIAANEHHENWNGNSRPANKSGKNPHL